MHDAMHSERGEDSIFIQQVFRRAMLHVPFVQAMLAPTDADARILPEPHDSQSGRMPKGGRGPEDQYQANKRFQRTPPNF